MALLQPKLHLKVSQRQILTPGLVQMVSVLALNKLELRDMINAEMVENPVLEELEDAVPLLDDVDRKKEDRDRPAPTAEENPIAAVEKKDPFEEIDFGSFFQDYLDPGYRSQWQSEEIERPSFENFLSKPSNLTDHLVWQLGSIVTRREVREAAELVIGNLNEDGYLIASDEELLGVALPTPPEADATRIASLATEATALGLGDVMPPADGAAATDGEYPADPTTEAWKEFSAQGSEAGTATAVVPAAEPPVAPPPPANNAAKTAAFRANFTLKDLHEAIELVRQLDPPGVACRNLRECLLYQLRFDQQQLESQKNGNGDREATRQALADAIAVVDEHLQALTNKQFKEIAKAISRPVEAVEQVLTFIRTLDPRPGLRYNKVEPRLIEPDVAFVKHGDEWLVIMNDEDVPQLRLNPAYRRLLSREGNDKDTRNYVKERYKSAIQLIKNIEQRKQTILKVCHSIVARQQEFLEKGIDSLKPMMIKEVARKSAYILPLSRGQWRANTPIPLKASSNCDTSSARASMARRAATPRC